MGTMKKNKLILWSAFSILVLGTILSLLYLRVIHGTAAIVTHYFLDYALPDLDRSGYSSIYVHIQGLIERGCIPLVIMLGLWIVFALVLAMSIHRKMYNKGMNADK